MELISPAKHVFANRLHDWQLAFSGSSRVTVNGFTFPSRYDLIYVEEAVIVDDLGNGEVGIKADQPPRPPKKEFVDTIVGTQTMINICANTGEIVNRALVDLINKISDANYTPDGVPVYQLTKGESTAKMDFMALKAEFSNFLQTAFMKAQDQFSTNAKRKEITRPLTQFIFDRNLYTHGRLILEVPTLKTLIKSRDPETKGLYYAEITTEAMQSFSNFAMDILDLFKTIEAQYPFRRDLAQPAAEA